MAEKIRRTVLVQNKLLDFLLSSEMVRVGGWMGDKVYCSVVSYDNHEYSYEIANGRTVLITPGCPL